MTTSYTLNWSDDTLKPPLFLTSDRINTSLTSLALTGKGVSNWGERVQENLIRLMENFASNGTAPQNVTPGQLWFDVTSSQLKMRTSNNSWAVIWPQFP